MNTDSLDKVFHALASPVRRQIIDFVVASPGCNVSDVSRPFDVSRIAVMKHLAVLEDADLIVSEKKGRSRTLYFNAVPIQMIHERWTDKFSAMWAGRLTAFKARMEQAS